jgi:hypothetical protein
MSRDDFIGIWSTWRQKGENKTPAVRRLNLGNPLSYISGRLMPICVVLLNPMDHV